MTALTYRGINYDTGTIYVPGHDSRPDWSPAVMRDHLTMIRDRLHCNAVNIFGSDPERLLAAATAAADVELQVWVQPRLPDADPAATLRHLGEVATAAEQLRRAGAAVRLNVGCELSVFADGLLPGRGYVNRARHLRWSWPLLPVFNRRLNRLLGRAAEVARDRFGGEITYGAGSWETVDWRAFDHVGLNHYRDAAGRATYAAKLADAVGHGRPVLVTEFGCCTYEGAGDLGAEGAEIVDWSGPARGRVRGDRVRDEPGQARYIGELIEIFVSTAVTGAFVFEFVEPAYPRADDPRHDLDLASFGIVAARLHDADGRYTYTPKAAFDEIARRYGPLT